MGKNKQRNRAPVVKSAGPSDVERLKASKLTVVATPECKDSLETLVNEANAKIESLIEEVSLEKDKILAEAKDEAEKTKSNAANKLAKERAEWEIEKNNFQEKEREAVLNDLKEKVKAAEAEAAEIISKAEAEAKSLKDEYAQKKEECILKNEEAIKTIAEYGKLRETVREDIQAAIMEELEERNSNGEALMAENLRLKSEVNDLRLRLEQCEAIKEAYATRYGDVKGAVSKITSLQIEKDTLSEEYNNLQEQFQQLSAEKSQLLIKMKRFGDDPDKLFRINDNLEAENKRLKDDLANLPSKENYQQLEREHEELIQMTETCAQLKKKVAYYEQRIKNVEYHEDELKNYKMFVKLLDNQVNELQNELDRNLSQYNSRRGKIFANLSAIDNSLTARKYNAADISLKELCSYFRGYLMKRKDNPLYYDERTIRTFIAGFASSHLMILEGLSGTGKSSLPKAFADFTSCKEDRIPVQSSWKDRNDLLGFYNDFKKQYKETQFLKDLYVAAKDSETISLIVLDEMNLSRIEYYFADLLVELEKPNPDDWAVELISDYAAVDNGPDSWPELIHEGKLRIGDNIWFIGTANKDDSTFPITDKVYDRAVTINFDKKGRREDIEYHAPVKISNSEFQDMLRATKYSSKKLDEFHEAIQKIDDKIHELFDITFGNRVLDQMDSFVPAYEACGGTRLEAIDIMIDRKVMRKLEGIYDPTLADNLSKFEKWINEARLPFELTKAHINNLKKRIV